MRRPLTLILAVCVFIFGWAVSAVSAAGLELTEQERAWLQSHKKIRISGPQAFPPFQYVDRNGAFKGMASDYVLHIADMVGLQVEIVKDRPWAEILSGIKDGKIDLLTCAAVTSERKEYLLFTRPHLVFPLVIVGRKDGPFIGGLDGLRNKTIAVTREVATVEWLQRDGIAATPLYVQSPLDGLKKVSLGKAYAVIENLAAATYLIEKNGLTNLKIAAPTTSWKDYALSIAVRRDWPEMVAIFDKGLAAMSYEQHNEIRQRWIAVRYEHGLRSRDIVLYMVAVGAVASLLVSAFVLWNRTLAREIKNRKTAEAEKERLIEELKGAMQEINTLQGILPICSECKNIRTEDGWLPIEYYISSHSEADFSHGLCPKCMHKLYANEDWFQQQDSAGKKSES